MKQNYLAPTTSTHVINALRVVCTSQQPNAARINSYEIGEDIDLFEN